MTTSDFSNFQLFVLVLSALLLFLYGLEHFSKELQTVGRDRLPRWLGLATRDRFRGLLLGASVTALVQSSSAVSALVVALVNAGTLSFASSLAVLLGAKVGTTATAWLVSFKLTQIGPYLIVLGGILTMLPFQIRVIGRAIFYFGFIFFTLDLIGQSLEPLRQAPWILEQLARASEPWIGVVLGALITMLLQSSSVVSGLAVVLVQQGVLSPEAAIAIVIGANAGTTVTALIASIPMDAFARRAAQMNTFFNGVGVLLMLPFVAPFARWAISMSSSPDQAVAIAHLTFNLGLALFFLPWTGWFGRRWAPKGEPTPSAQNAPV
ncbi:MAG TPA: Na/Pi symporter [Hydrogenophaga sp.]|uniref:Na/Pi cotransporter family protein n=1 Tax=Hydrogenophaga sp. TaxID=1904254 RepID=UPI002C30A691|nr:Na/Pi symporter [Hydrogenophaga sp.]HMN93783.1 Na/Pi symporter [Hydrogenophaga sp.]HMP09694.1 Na/Pi symporter [Hydrogenophaga sp.]